MSKGKNKHYFKTETGECYCDALRDAMAVVNKQIYLVTKSNLPFFFIFGKASVLYSEDTFIWILYVKNGAKWYSHKLVLAKFR